MEGGENRKIVVGVCAMSKKSKSKPMKEILSRVQRHPAIEIVIFSDETILNEPVTSWPDCNCLISFYSSGFPLQKAIAYVELKKPFVVNDLPAQYDLQDRRRVYKILQESGIAMPRYAIYNDGDEPVEERHDHIRVAGVEFSKPFVEKPVDAEDHNIHIYYPSDAGGGSQRLFRKIGNKSSEYSKEGLIRRNGSFIYEDFKATGGTDVKVYTVGPDYAHAEARKSPALDGRVNRDNEGKEIRYPVILTAKEKQMARTVALAFKQTVCGFDLLRANGKSYVCDVNGFSFVKTSKKYCDDCSHILLGLILTAVAPDLLQNSTKLPLVEPVQWVGDESENEIQLRCVVGIIRHGDRTPKQKMKMEVFDEKFHALVRKYGKDGKKHIKLKTPSQLKEVLGIARYLLNEAEKGNPPVREEIYKLERLKSVLEMYGSLSGINRKVQFRYCCRKGSGYARNKKLASPPPSPDAAPPSTSSRVLLLLILKWGGELTTAGCAQAEELGKEFRTLYQDDDPGTGLGILRLHSTYRHDLKIYASDEGRVQMTAAAFAKGLLALEGGLTSILVSLVHTDEKNSMLDYSSNMTPIMDSVKARLHQLMQVDEDMKEEDMLDVAPTGTASLMASLRAVKNPFAACKLVHELVWSIKNRLDARIAKRGSSAYECNLFHGESLILMAARWDKLAKDFKMKNGLFDISKIPDIYDCVQYDLLHNRHAVVPEWQELHDIISKLADVIVPQEYGMTRDEKVEISQAICSGLLRKMRADFNHNVAQVENEHRLNPSYYDGADSPYRHVRSRLYFTSESHVHSMLNILRHGGLFPDRSDAVWDKALLELGAVPELNYMTRFVFRLYEDTSRPIDSDSRYLVKIQFSAGAQRWDKIQAKRSTEKAFRKSSGGSRRQRHKLRVFLETPTLAQQSGLDAELKEGEEEDEEGEEEEDGIGRGGGRGGWFGSTENLEMMDSPARRRFSRPQIPLPPPPPSPALDDRLSVERKLSYGRMMVRAEWAPDSGSGSERASERSRVGRSSVVRKLDMNPLVNLHSSVPLNEIDGLLRRVALTEEEEAKLKSRASFFRVFEEEASPASN